MAQGNAKAQIQGVEIGYLGIVRLTGQDQADQHTGDQRLKGIPQKHDQPRLLSHDPEYISGSGVPAPMLTDIRTMELAVDISGLQKTAQITGCKTDDPSHRYCSFPFRSRTMNFNEVPLKPNAFRIWFSKYRI